MTISIITPTFNAGKTIRETLESVFHQLENDTEHLLLDACSTDQTLDVVKGYPHLIAKSESDSGIYDAMNKGAALAKGKWLLFLQGDDWLPDGTLTAYRRALELHPEVDVLCGDCEAVKESGGSWSPVWSVTDSVSKKLTIKNIALGEPMINARLIRRDVFLRLGGFSLKYSLASDRDFLFRAAIEEVRQQEIKAFTYRYRWHRGSSTMTEGNSLAKRLSSENISIVRSYLNGSMELNSNDREALRTWHTRLTVHAAMNAFESLDSAFLPSFIEGQQEDSLWSIVFLHEMFRSIPGFLRRGCRTRSQVVQRQ